MVVKLKVGTNENIVTVLGYLDINCIQVVGKLKIGTDENIVKVLGYRTDENIVKVLDIPGYKLYSGGWKAQGWNG